MAQPANPNFFLGKVFDTATGKAGDAPLMYDPANLTTHAIITGMTGSGKTGLGIGLLEEAALHNIPAIIIDPKGDLTNLLLHFPNLAPADFEPWIDPEAARRSGKSVPDMAAETAASWTTGLAGWGLGAEQITALRDSAAFTVYTPGSTSGVPVNVLSSFSAPDVDWASNQEVLIEKVTSIVTALLSLVGMNDIDPLRSREHILLSNIIQHAWAAGTPLDMNELILQVQNPPFERLGAFPLDSFFPEKDRMSLAILLNNFLASPSFQVWLSGQALDLPNLLYQPDGKPRHSIFYIAHLSESERMFFVTLLFAAVESWMRAQRGTSGLRAMLYFDEIMGYLPPIANPPSRTVILRMLKQARAFGVGLVLATQNPVDVDYKALSNAGTWLIGRLQTDQDKQRLLDGLQSAGGSMDRSEYDKLLSGLGKRVFLLHDVRQNKPALFQTRWTLNYLAGPLTRTQIPDLNRLLGSPAATAAPARPAAAPAAAPTPQPTQPAQPAAAPVAAAPAATQRTPAAPTAASPYSVTRPNIPGAVVEYFAPTSLGVTEAVNTSRMAINAALQPEGVIYRAALLAQVEVRYLQRKYNLESTQKLAAVVTDPGSGLLRWEEFAWPPYDPRQLQSQPLPQTRFATLPAWLGDPRRISDLQKDFIDWVYRNSTIQVRANETLKVYAGPEVSAADFREQCASAARDAMQAELDKLTDPYQRKVTALEQKIDRQEMEVKEQEAEVSQRTIEGLAAGGELLLSLLGGRKKSLSSSLSKNRQRGQAKADLEQEKQELEGLKKQLEDLKAQQEDAVKRVQDSWAKVVNTVTEVPIVPQKKDIFSELFGVLWQPYYLFNVNGQSVEVPAFPPAPR